MSEKRIAIVPGSFDPITNGHLDIIRRAAQTYDTVYVAVMINSAKKYMFDIHQRTKIAEAAVCGMDNVFVISSEGMLWQLAKDLGACAIVKGVRNEIDRAYEEKMAKYNAKYNPAAKTVLLDADPQLECVSSTRVREMLLAGQSLECYLPASAISVILEIQN